MSQILEFIVDSRLVVLLDFNLFVKLPLDLLRLLLYLGIIFFKLSDLTVLSLSSGFNVLQIVFIHQFLIFLRHRSELLLHLLCLSFSIFYLLNYAQNRVAGFLL